MGTNCYKNIERKFFMFFNVGKSKLRSIRTCTHAAKEILEHLDLPSLVLISRRYALPDQCRQDTVSPLVGHQIEFTVQLTHRD